MTLIKKKKKKKESLNWPPRKNYGISSLNIKVSNCILQGPLQAAYLTCWVLFFGTFFWQPFGTFNSTNNWTVGNIRNYVMKLSIKIVPSNEYQMAIYVPFIIIFYIYILVTKIIYWLLFICFVAVLYLRVYCGLHWKIWGYT